MFQRMALILLSLSVAACGGGPEKVIETVVVRETVVETAVETVIQTVVETVEVTVVVENPRRFPVRETERTRTAILDIHDGPVPFPDLFNPFLPGRRLDQGFHQAVIEPLFIVNYGIGEIEPWLGTEMSSNETFDVWTLQLREAVTWSDGEVFDADDVVFTIEMLMQNAPELVWSAAIAESVESVERVDDLTVQFNLRRPNPRFQLERLSVQMETAPSIVPEHIWRDRDPLTFTNYDPAAGWPVFTGPYKVASVSEREFEYVRDDAWWGAGSGWKELPRPEKLIWVWYGPEETRTAAMANDGLDSLVNVSLGAFLALEKRNPNVTGYFNDAPFAWVPEPCSRTFEINHTVAPWGDPDMRWALNYAIDRDEIVAVAYEGATIKSRHFFPAYPALERYVDLLEEAGLYDAFPLTVHDPARAREVIASKGYALNEETGFFEQDGQTLALEITTHAGYVDDQRVAQVLVEQLRRSGVEATQRSEAGGAWNDNFGFGAFEARVGGGSCGSVVEPWTSMNTFNVRWWTPTGERAIGNGWRWSGERADAYGSAVDQVGFLPVDDPKIDELFVEAMGYWFEDLPLIPVVQARVIAPFNTTYWTNWPTVDNDYVQPPTWWGSAQVILHALEPAE